MCENNNENRIDSEPNKDAAAVQNNSAADDEKRYSFKAFKKSKVGNRILLTVLSIFLAVLIVFVGYIAYLLIDYHRIPDNQQLTVNLNTSEKVKTDTPYNIISYNVGFAAYTPDFGFFMDGGKESRAKSEASVCDTLSGIANLLKAENPDFIMLEEVDEKATRSHYVDEINFLKNELKEKNSVYAVNFDSSYLFYPFLKPHGKTLGGLMTFSKYEITESLRRSLPIENSLMKFVDLDRCYTVSRLPTDNSKELVLFTVHLSAYTSDGVIADEQFKMLTEDMESEYKKGNYVVCGGDFNKDLLGDSTKYFGTPENKYNWAQPVKVEYLNGTGLSLKAPIDESNPVPSCRNADGPYNPKQFVVTVDGFIVSDNITVINNRVIDTGFKYSDHNPVTMNFKLN